METPIPVVAVGDANFEEEVRRWSENRRNLIVIGNSEQEIRQRLATLLNLDGYSPDCIHRWGIYALSDVLAPGDLGRLLAVNREGKSICIVEQLKLRTTKPPHIKPVIIYSEPQGVIADVDSLDAAKKFLSKNRNAWMHLQKFPLAGIYEWEEDQWRKARVFV
jgi:hypothetical protein